MSMRINIENILKSHKDVFYEILNKLTHNNIDLAKTELERTNCELDEQLFEAIELTLDKLRDEEGFLSRFLYSSFGIGRHKNKRRDQLLILGGQLKSQYNETQRTLTRIKHYEENLDSSRKNLYKLRQGFQNKIAFLPSILLQERSQKYMEQIDFHIKRIHEYETALEERRQRLKANTYEYKSLFKRIPRYHELREENYLELVAPKEA